MTDLPTASRHQVAYLFRTEVIRGKWTHEIAIRGTTNFLDLLRDVDAAQIRDTDLDFDVHSGFSAGARAIYEDIQRRNRLKPGYAVNITGHSLGGAMAVLLAMYLQQLNGLTVSEVTTFAQPKVVTNEGTRNFPVLNQNILRVVGCDDVIPFLPPPPLIGWVTGGYQHVGAMILLLDGVNFDYAVAGDIERPFAGVLQRGFVNSRGREQFAFGHRLAQYLASLRAKMTAARALHYNDRDVNVCIPKRVPKDSG